MAKIELYSYVSNALIAAAHLIREGDCYDESMNRPVYVFTNYDEKAGIISEDVIDAANDDDAINGAFFEFQSDFLTKTGKRIKDDVILSTHDSLIKQWFDKQDYWLTRYTLHDVAEYILSCGMNQPCETIWRKSDGVKAIMEKVMNDETIC